MRIRRILVLIVFSVLIAGAIIWFILLREGAFATVTEATKLSATTSVTSARNTDDGTLALQTPNASAVSRSGPVKPGRTVRNQIDVALPKRFLPAESQLIAKDQLNQDAAQRILRSPRFDDFVRKMRDEMMANTAARDVGDLYIGAIRNNLNEMPGLTLEDFACGATICVGSIESAAENPVWDQWMKKFDDDSSVPTYVFVEAPVDLSGGVTQHRIVFSTDPDSNAVTGAF